MDKSKKRQGLQREENPEETAEKTSSSGSYQFGKEEWVVYLVDLTGISKDRIEKLIASPEYKYYKIKQGNKIRQIEEPLPETKKLQQTLLPLLSKFKLHKACMAIPGLGVGDNAKVHSGAKYLLKIDIKGCYQAIRLKYLEDFGEITKLCFCQDKRGRWMLPTGAPTSPILCNILLTPLDVELSRLAKEKKYRYTRYLDDMIFSTTASKRDWNLIDEVICIVKSHGYQPNYKKTRWLTRDKDSLTVTGVNVGKRNAASRKMKKTVRAMLHRLATTNDPIDARTNGYLAYIYSIDQYAHQKLLTFYEEKRQKYVST